SLSAYPSLSVPPRSPPPTPPFPTRRSSDLTALRLAEGILVVDFVDPPQGAPDRTRRFSEKRACPNDHPLAIDDIEPRTFSFNARSEEHTSELQSRFDLVCRLLLEKKKQAPR